MISNREVNRSMNRRRRAIECLKRFGVEMTETNIYALIYMQEGAQEEVQEEILATIARIIVPIIVSILTALIISNVLIH